MHDVFSFFLSLASSHFFKMALLASMSASIISGIIGSYIVVKRIVFISGSISHSVLGGIGFILYLQYALGFHTCAPLYGALIAAILSALLIGLIRIFYKQREDTVIASLWAFGMSVGVIFISLTPGQTGDLSLYLFGSLLWASQTDVYLLLTLSSIAILLVSLLHRRLLAICFDEQQASLQKQPVIFLYLLLLVLIAITVVLLIQVVGAILVIAFLSLPAAIANTWTQRLSKMMGLAVIISMGISFCGMSLSYLLNWPPGATIALTATVLYLGNLIRKKG